MIATTRITLVFVLSLAVSSGTSHAVPTWISAFDNTGSLPGGAIDHNIGAAALNLEILGLRFYRVDGGGLYVEMAPYLGLGSTLQDHYDQAWSWTGYETDNYKFLSVDTGSKLSTFYIADDHDIVNPGGGPFIRQTAYSGTPMGLVTSGYNTQTFWLDHGTATYNTSPIFGSNVYRLDVLADIPVPEPTACCLLCGVLTGLGLKRKRRKES